MRKTGRPGAEGSQGKQEQCLSAWAATRDPYCWRGRRIGLEGRARWILRDRVEGVTCTSSERDGRVDPGKHTSTGQFEGRDGTVGLPYLALLLPCRLHRGACRLPARPVRYSSAEQGATRSDR